MPELSAAARGAGGQTPRGDRAPLSDLQVRNQSRYGTATTDPLGRDGPGWHKGDSGLPVINKGWKRDPKTGRAVKEATKGDQA